MPIAADLPDDIDALKQLVVARTVERDAFKVERDAAVAERDAAKAGLVNKTLEAEKLKFQLARLKRMTFGASSERIRREIEQLELKLEELESDEVQGEPAATPEPPAEEHSGSAREKKRRRQFPEHLPRTTATHEPAPTCASCGSDRLRKVGEDVTEVLDYIPGRFEVVRHVRPAYSCRTCEAMMQAPMPSLPIPRGQAGAGLLAHIAIGKYCDHIPLYRQAEIYARDGVDLDRATLADWVGRIAWLVQPLADRIGEHVIAGSVIHADDTPIPVLAPGNGKTKTGRLWVYLRDERPHAGSCGTHASGMAPPAVLYRYTPDRKGEHCRAHLAPFRGHLHADGYSGFQELYESAQGMPAAVTEVACWAHARRYFFDVHHKNGSPIAKEALDKIGALFGIERAIAGQIPERRRRVREDAAKPRLDALKLWFDEQLKLIPGRSDLAGAIRYARSRWDALTRYVDNGRLEISNNAAENAIRPLKLGAKNWLFLGSDAGGERAAIFYTLIRSAKLNGVQPEAYLRVVFTHTADPPIYTIDELLPWNISQPATQSVAA
jgi:transposase